MVYKVFSFLLIMMFFIKDLSVFFKISMRFFPKASFPTFSIKVVSIPNFLSAIPVDEI